MSTSGDYILRYSYISRGLVLRGEVTISKLGTVDKAFICMIGTLNICAGSLPRLVAISLIQAI